MKQILLALVCFFSVQAMAWTDEDKPITVSQLPQTAQQFIKKHFASHKVALAKMDHDIFNKSYDVIFTNGDKIEFEGNGKWSEVKCPKTEYPAPSYRNKSETTCKTTTKAQRSCRSKKTRLPTK